MKSIQMIRNDLQVDIDDQSPISLHSPADAGDIVADNWIGFVEIFLNFFTFKSCFCSLQKFERFGFCAPVFFFSFFFF